MLAGGCSPRQEAPPNVVVLSIDTLRHDHLGVYGHGAGTSPALDRLAAQGTVFANCFSTASWTLPSHASMLTGQYPSSLGLIGRGKVLPEEKITLAELLASQGYETAGFYSVPWLGPYYGVPQGFGIYESPVGRNPDGSWPTDAAATTSGPAVVDRALDWLRDRSEERPFFLFLHMFDPHKDFLARTPYDVYFDPEDYGQRAPGPLAGPRSKLQVPTGVAERNRLLALYDGEIRFEDRCVQRLVESMEEQGLLDETLFILVSDHGEEFLEHGGQDHGRTLFEEVVHVPLIVRYPGVFDGGRIVSEVVSPVDLLPTVADLLGLDVSDHVQGLPLQHVLDGRADRPGVISERKRSIALRSGDWKLILDRKSGEVRLFSTLDDPGEQTDVAEAWPEIHERYVAHLRDIDADRLAPDAEAEDAVVPPEVEEELRALGYTD